MRCKVCGEDACDRHGFFIGKARKIETFSGSSPPEIFVGRWNYPNVYTGILSPSEYGDTSALSSPEVWHARKLSIPDILANRNKLLYARSQMNIKKLDAKFTQVMQEVAMTHKSIAAEYKLKKPIQKNHEHDFKVPLISHAAEVKSVELQENPCVKPKVEYLVNDTEVKSKDALLELENSGLETSNMIKLLSAGLLGLKANRKLVPTRWSITAIDDMLSKEKLKEIKSYKELAQFRLFHASYLGNHYEFLLLPNAWSFEVIEISLKNGGVWHDHESFFPRTAYADDVTGAYYANRLAVTEYLQKIQRQASCLVLRQISPDYTAPLGVGILRQVSREAFSKQPETPSSLDEAYTLIQSRLNLPLTHYLEKSTILETYGAQKKISEYF
ncbi:hypothetical protein HYZ97_02630 [Candidatus Pacearchaeota archaeon]|nr:hypothetical protein [Candidatus Pacearchaeota archaeon]